MDFKVVLDILVKKLKENKIDFALIGGFALLSSGVERMTNDLDLLVPKECSDKVSIIMSELDYSNIFKSDETAMFDSPVELFGRVDFMFAQRKYTEEMLERAKEISVFNNAFRVKVVLPEDIIGLKIQSCSNNPDRYVKDMLDVENLLKLHRNEMDMELVREYFKLFNREKELDELLKKNEKIK